MTTASKKANAPTIIPLVLSGGAGTRLWPVSLDSMPKQFLKLGGEHTLLQETLIRCSGAPFSDKPIIVALSDQADIILVQAKAIKIEAELVLEPARRDSCAAVLAGACHALQRDPDALVMIVAADHHIADAEAFRSAVAEAATAAQLGNIVTFGIKPSFPATGYGYILPGQAIEGTSCTKVERFREKPASEVAETYIKDGCLWNSGNFLARADTLVQQAEKFASGVWEPVLAASRQGKREGSVFRPDRELYQQAQKISFDFAIMEKTDRAAVKPVHYMWNDIGTWDSVAKTLTADENNNATSGRAAVVEGTGNFVFSTGPLTVVQGLEDIIVIATKDAVLVTRKGSSENVKALVQEIHKRGLELAPGSATAVRNPQGTGSGHV